MRHRPCHANDAIALAVCVSVLVGARPPLGTAAIFFVLFTMREHKLSADAIQCADIDQQERQVLFEYRVMDSLIFDRRRKELETELNELGCGGWEMVAACGLHNQTFVFMRQVSESPKRRKAAAAETVKA